ncbi:hypothetical protein CERSUDRAFT_91575 [Gelatoporia subvermispora B]|uniref:WW domain-containing protein n=1 Tax=Ceriporiopsis subvermispora (strain B) TaxID=914234 RepID=M2PVN1_CERS8|nr:hypothetical protein CERSUDRAFT_91575 [Gelatoporia subvermispora B]
MSAPPPFVQLSLPPLPPGWTEHISPGGQPYYFNTQTQESTYVRPLPTFLIPPQVVPPAVAPAKKEKPKIKTPIPGTDWLRVITTAGNVFYTNKAKKESLWTVPEEIKDAVAALEKEEKEREKRELKEKEEATQKAEETRLKEVERIKSEVEDAVGKRKAEEAVPVDELVISKKPRVEESEDEEDEDSEDESDEEEWQREAAAQLAAEAEEEKKRQEEEKQRQEEEAKTKEAELEKAAKQLNMPARVDLSIEEAKALFKTLLREKDINPLHPWDMSLPLFINDPRYVFLPSVSARREAFDEYCRDRARELRQSQVKKEKEASDPKGEFERLLREEVTSTRTSWTEWRRQWKKDRRFYGWGRDDREREKRFREYLKELGEKKRAAAQKAEAEFFALLRESGITKPDAHWKDVKRKISSDPRYDAVGSSSLREELFNTFLKAHQGPATSEPPVSRETSVPPKVEIHEVDPQERERLRKERKERAVKEREEKVRAERSRVEADIDRSRSSLTKEEGELQFKTMLTDAIRDPQVTWDDALPELQKDPRFTHSPLPINQQVNLFHAHVEALRSKYMTNLRALFESNAPGLDTPFTALPVSSILSSLPIIKLGYGVDRLEHEYDKWQRERNTDARAAFDQMLHENAFVEFWGRLGKIGGKGVDESIKADDIGDDAEEEQVDMKALAKTVDLKEMTRVLQNDKRYLVFDHIPEQREGWIRDHLARLSAPKLSVHVPEHS